MVFSIFFLQSIGCLKVQVGGDQDTVRWFRNPAVSPVEVGSLSHSLEGLYIPGGCLGFRPSTVSLAKSGSLEK